MFSGSPTYKYLPKNNNDAGNGPYKSGEPTERSDAFAGNGKKYFESAAY